MNRKQRRQKPQQTETLSIPALKARIRAEMASEVDAAIDDNTHRLIDGMLLAMNTLFGFGPVRAERVVTKASEFIQAMSSEELHTLTRRKVFKEKI